MRLDIKKMSNQQSQNLITIIHTIYKGDEQIQTEQATSTVAVIVKALGISVQVVSEVVRGDGTLTSLPPTIRPILLHEPNTINNTRRFNKLIETLKV